MACGNTTPTAEWNTHVDPHAAAEVFAAYAGHPADRLPVVCALETTERIEMRPEHLAALAEAAGCAEASPSLAWVLVFAQVRPCRLAALLLVAVS